MPKKPVIFPQVGEGFEDVMSMLFYQKRTNMKSQIRNRSIQYQGECQTSEGFQTCNIVECQLGESNKYDYLLYCSCQIMTEIDDSDLLNEIQCSNESCKNKWKIKRE
jgi:hypothetical protein